MMQSAKIIKITSNCPHHKIKSQFRKHWLQM